MPELPEVETVASGLDTRVRGDRIAQVWLGSHREPFRTPPGPMAAGLEGSTILAVHRSGKHIVFELGGPRGAPGGRGPQRGGAQWIVHLGMTGRLVFTDPGAQVVVHTHARVLLDGGGEVRFVDPRRFGRLEFRDLGREEGFTAPGREPLEIGAEEFRRLFRGRRVSIKAALLNQALLSGVGNIYADESLFRAGIRPRRMAGRLRGEELERLRRALREVLEHAIRRGGSSVSDYVDANGVRGFFQLEHRVYRRGQEPCRECGTPIRRIVLAGRSTHYCPGCQR